MLSQERCEIGIIGLGVMGRNLLLNIASHGFSVAGYDKDEGKVNSLREEARNDPKVYETSDIQRFIGELKRPRAILLLVPAGKVVDSVIQDLLPNLQKGDLIIDAGNSFYKDTERRIHDLKAKGLEFMGIGISGGEEGARFGPSIMPGGSKDSYQRIQAILEAISAKAQGEPCVSYLGPGSSGHFVKMIHNGIEYGIMQLIAESYDIMKRGLGIHNDKLYEIYHEWNQGKLNSYLIEITSLIFKQNDNNTSIKLIDKISDVARQLGTGMWTSQAAMELVVPAPNIDIAVSMRDLSVYVKDRQEISSLYYAIHDFQNKPHVNRDPLFIKQFIQELEEALYVAIIMVYCQGMAILRAGSDKYLYDLNLETIAKIWRGGCIIRADLLQDIVNAYARNKQLSHLLLDPVLSKKILKYQESLRKTISQSLGLMLPMPGLMVSLAYFDAFRSSVLPSNLIQAQRDYFGSHGYERIDIKGSFHTEWRLP